jgi:hypothetical protein
MSGPTLPLPDRREQVVQRLTAAFAAGRIELDDLEQRLDRVMRATSLEEVDATLAGLAEPARAVSPAPASNPGEFAIDHQRRRTSKLSFIMMGGLERKGRWAPSRHHVGLAFMGGSFLDFREAHLQPGVTHVYLGTMWGGIEVAVPEGLDVEVSGLALMGGLGRVDEESGSTDPRRPQLRIHAFALMGGVEVKVLKPGEPFEQKRRKRRKKAE